MPSNIVGDAAELNLLPMIVVSIVAGLTLPVGSPLIQIVQDLNVVVTTVVSFLIGIGAQPILPASARLFSLRAFPLLPLSHRSPTYNCEEDL